LRYQAWNKLQNQKEPKAAKKEITKTSQIGTKEKQEPLYSE
jgi:hypothetical protein